MIKKLLFTILILSLCVSANAVSSGVKYPTNATENSYGNWSDEDWSPNPNPTTVDQIYADDGNYAISGAAAFDTDDQTYAIYAFAFDFSGIPAGATIDGVTAEINCWYDNGAASMDLCMLLDADGAPAGDNQCSTPVALSTDDTTIIEKGSTSDTWGNSLTLSWVQDSDFGLAIGFIATGENADVMVDYVRLTVEYTEAAGEEYSHVMSIFIN